MKAFLIPLLIIMALLAGCQHATVRHVPPQSVQIVEHHHVHSDVVTLHQHEGGHHSGHQHRRYAPTRVVVVTPAPQVRHAPTRHFTVTRAVPAHREQRHDHYRNRRDNHDYSNHNEGQAKSHQPPGQTKPDTQGKREKEKHDSRSERHGDHPVTGKDRGQSEGRRRNGR